VETVLHECSISVTPGTVFGDGGEGFIRIALSQPNNRIKEAMNRIEKSKASLLL
jgi:LL-diaminopimelate aminotransferase